MNLACTQPFAQHLKQDGYGHTQCEHQQCGIGLRGDHSVVNLHRVERGGQGQHGDGDGGGRDVEQRTGMTPDFGPNQLKAGAVSGRKTGRHAQAYALAAGSKVAHGFFAELPLCCVPALYGPAAVAAAGQNERRCLARLEQQRRKAGGVGLITALQARPAQGLGQRHQGLMELRRGRVFGQLGFAQQGLQLKHVKGFAAQLRQAHQAGDEGLGVVGCSHGGVRGMGSGGNRSVSERAGPGRCPGHGCSGAGVLQPAKLVHGCRPVGRAIGLFRGRCSSVPASCGGRCRTGSRRI